MSTIWKKKFFFKLDYWVWIGFVFLVLNILKITLLITTASRVKLLLTSSPRNEVEVFGRKRFEMYLGRWRREQRPPDFTEVRYPRDKSEYGYLVEWLYRVKYSRLLCTRKTHIRNNIRFLWDLLHARPFPRTRRRALSIPSDYRRRGRRRDGWKKIKKNPFLIYGRTINIILFNPPLTRALNPPAPSDADPAHRSIK